MSSSHDFLHWRNQELGFSERPHAAQVVSPENLIDKARFLLVTFYFRRLALVPMDS
jgi:hypothetical protein